MAAATAFKSPVPPPPHDAAWSSPATRPRARTLTYPLTPPTLASETVPPFVSCVSGPALHTTGPEMPESEWYIPVSQSPYSQYGFENAYTTPHSSSIPSFSPMVDMTKAQESSYPALAGYHHPSMPVHDASQAPDVKPAPAFVDTSKPQDNHYYGFVPVEPLPNRPRSSPSTFSPTSSRPEEFSWTGNPLGITDSSLPDHHHPHVFGHQHPSLANRAPRLSEPSDLVSPQPKRNYQPIAPNPMGVQRINQLKRPRDEEESPDGKRRKRSTSSAFSMDLSEEDRLLIHLKDDENMPWKDIAAKFQSDLGKTYQIPALQMRLKRLRERLRVWTEADLRALRLAHEYWIQSKFEIIAAKMLEFGAQERWTSRQCARKWQEIDPGPTFPAAAFEHAPPPNMHTPYATFTTSPTEAPGFLPFLHIPS